MPEGVANRGRNHSSERPGACRWWPYNEGLNKTPLLACFWAVGTARRGKRIESCPGVEPGLPEDTSANRPRPSDTSLAVDSHVLSQRCPACNAGDEVAHRSRVGRD